MKTTSALLRYGAIGVLNTAVGYSLILLLQAGLEWNPNAANAGGYIAGWCIAYVLNRRYTFSSTAPHRLAAPAFALAALSCFLLNLAVLNAATAMGVPKAWSQALAVLAYTVSFFLVCKLLVFRASGSTDSN